MKVTVSTPKNYAILDWGELWDTPGFQEDICERHGANTCREDFPVDFFRVGHTVMCPEDFDPITDATVWADHFPEWQGVYLTSSIMTNTGGELRGFLTRVCNHNRALVTLAQFHIMSTKTTTTGEQQ